MFPITETQNNLWKQNRAFCVHLWKAMNKYNVFKRIKKCCLRKHTTNMIYECWWVAVMRAPLVSSHTNEPWKALRETNSHCRRESQHAPLKYIYGNCSKAKSAEVISCISKQTEQINTKDKGCWSSAGLMKAKICDNSKNSSKVYVKNLNTPLPS